MKTCYKSAKTSPADNPEINVSLKVAISNFFRAAELPAKGQPVHRECPEKQGCR
jgi:hypothetical protein